MRIEFFSLPQFPVFTEQLPVARSHGGMVGTEDFYPGHITLDQELRPVAREEGSECLNNVFGVREECPGQVSELHQCSDEMRADSSYFCSQENLVYLSMPSY